MESCITCRESYTALLEMHKENKFKPSILNNAMNVSANRSPASNIFLLSKQKSITNWFRQVFFNIVFTPSNFAASPLFKKLHLREAAQQHRDFSKTLGQRWAIWHCFFFDHPFCEKKGTSTPLQYPSANQKQTETQGRNINSGSGFSNTPYYNSQAAKVRPHHKGVWKGH